MLREERIKNLRRRKADLEVMQQRLLDGYIAGAIDKNKFTSRTALHKDGMDQVDVNIPTARAKLRTGLAQALEAFDLAQNVAERWRVSNQADRRALLESVLLKRTLNAPGLVTTKRKPFDVLVEGLQSERKSARTIQC